MSLSKNSKRMLSCSLKLFYQINAKLCFNNKSLKYFKYSFVRITHKTCIQDLVMHLEHTLRDHNILKRCFSNTASSVTLYDVLTHFAHNNDMHFVFIKQFFKI